MRNGWARQITSGRFVSHVLSWLLVMAIQASCAGRPATPNPPRTPEEFAATVRQAGGQVYFGQEVGPTRLGLSAQAVYIGTERVWLFHAPQDLDPKAVVEEFDGLQYVWTNEGLLVQYGGRDGGTILLIDGLLGEPLIRPPVAGEEPYPPAVPIAIRSVAEELEVEPEQVIVRAYEMKDWSDSCLEFEEPSEDCLDVITPGWRIELSVGSYEIEAHTDLLGDHLRWRVR